MKVWLILLDKFAKWCVGGVPFESAKRVTAALDNASITGPQKKEIAIHELKTLGYDLTSFLLNSAIELAVIYIGLQAGKKNG
jgi:hypothetical protein